MNWATLLTRLSHLPALACLPYKRERGKGTGPMHKTRPWSSTLRARQKAAVGGPRSRRAGPVPARWSRFARAERWSLVFGESALYAIVVLAATGVYLAVFFDPAMKRVAYHGSYAPLRGLPVSKAYESTMDLSFDVRGGLLMRQIHHWAALIFAAAVCLVLLRLFLTGALRIMPGWEIEVAGHPLTLAVLVPALIVPGAFFTLLAAYPLLERRLTGDQGLHHLPDRPRDAATRTAIGAAGITFYGLLWAAAANDQIAYHFHLDLYTVTWFFRVAVLAGPLLAYTLTQRICLGLTSREQQEAEHGHKTGRIVMSPGGGFSEITEPASRALQNSLHKP